MMNDSVPMSTMLSPYSHEGNRGPYSPMSHHIPSIYEHHHHAHHQQPPKRFFPFKVPRVVKDQKATFESDELFKKLARESEVS